jgi:hypothetical protein
MEELFGSDNDDDDVVAPPVACSPGAVSTASERRTNEVIRKCNIYLASAKPEGDDEDEDDEDEGEDDEDEGGEEEEEEDYNEDDDDEDVEDDKAEAVDDDEDKVKVKVEEGDGAEHRGIEDKGGSRAEGGREEEVAEDLTVIDESGGKVDKVKVSMVKGDGADRGIEDKVASSDQGGREEEAEDRANGESGGEEKDEVGEDEKEEGRIMLDAVRSTHSLAPDFVCCCLD